jgi:hypothetical protein
MMRVKCKDKKVRQFAEWVVNYYNIRRGEVKIVATEKKDKNAAYAEDFGGYRYELTLHMPSIRERGNLIIACVAHELTHIKQYQQNNLGDTGRGSHAVVTWKNQIWRGDEVRNDHDYFFNPWEIEARYMESPLCWFYMKHLKNELRWKKSKRLKWYVL